MNPENIHKIVFSGLKLSSVVGLSPVVRKAFSISDKRLEREVFGIKFPNPVGLAAGLDKNAEAYKSLANLGFGFIEVGTVTPKPQPGNSKPRLFRLVKDSAIINRMGFNNNGVGEMLKRLKRRNKNIIIGGNIGKNTATPNEEAINDYEYCFNELFDYVDYFVVNVSCPNVSDLRKLQDKDSLTAILMRLQTINNDKSKRKPILLKISPDLNNEQLDDVISIVKNTQIDGLVATNTTVTRNGLSYSQKHVEDIGNGGLSGKPITDRSTEIINYLVEKSNNEIPIIGVGGIMSGKDAIDKLKAGAKLVQIYTGFIYEGPGLIKEINKSILRHYKE